MQAITLLMLKITQFSCDGLTGYGTLLGSGCLGMRRIHGKGFGRGRWGLGLRACTARTAVSVDLFLKSGLLRYNHYSYNDLE